MTIALERRPTHAGHRGNNAGQWNSIVGHTLSDGSASSGEDTKGPPKRSLSSMATRPFVFYLALLGVMIPLWVVLRGIADLTFATTAALLLPIVAALSIASAIRK